MKKKIKPNKYNVLVEPRLKTIKAWRRRGMIEKEICKNLGVSTSIFSNYKRDHIELIEALRTGKADADAQVENALFKTACGFEYDEVETIIHAPVMADGKVDTSKGRVARIRKVRKMITPNVTAQLAYLQNRCSDRWKDSRKRVEVTGLDGQPIKTIDESKHGDNIVNIFNDPKELKRIAENAAAGADIDIQSNRGPFFPLPTGGVCSSE